MSAGLKFEESTGRKEAALALAEQGFYLLAVDPNSKRPDKLLAPSGFKDATQNQETIAAWFDAKPTCNIGIACGAQFGIVVVDVDVKNGANGIQTMKNLGLEGVMTLTADTPSCGFHFYFKHPGIPLRAKLDGIDLKGADGGGYVLAPPSELPNGVYRWRDREIPIAEFPKEVLDQLRVNASKPCDNTSAGKGPAELLKIPEGRRHNRLVELGAIYRGKGLQADEIEVLLWEHAQRYFDPPFNHDNPEDINEIEAVVRWYDGKAPPEASAAPLEVLTTAQLIARADIAPQEDVLEPILPAGGSLMIHGVTGVGKSHIGIAVALATSRGCQLLDWSAPRAVATLYVDGEMPLQELKARIEQYLCGKAPPDQLFWIAARASDQDLPDLASLPAQARYLEAIERCAARVVVYDNLTCLRQTSMDAPENSVEAWYPIASFIRRLNGQGVAVVLVHHSAKSGTQRGSSAHTASMDTVLRIVAPGERQADPRAELDVEIFFEKHRRFGGEATLPIRAKVIGDADGYGIWQRGGTDPLVDDVVRLRNQGLSIRETAKTLERSRKGIEKAIERAKARGLLPLAKGAD